MKHNTPQNGFSLVEMIVSLALFSIVVTVAVGALLSLIATNRQLQAEQSVMTNLSFALDSMTREIRTGTHYFCDAQTNYNSGSDKIFKDGVNAPPSATDLDTLADRTQDCATGNTGGLRLQGIAFKESGDSITGAAERILYFFDETEGKIYRRVGSGLAQSIVSSGIFIENAEFFVTGSAPQNGGSTDDNQAIVTIYLEAKEVNDPAAKPYKIQTTITQRTLDI